LDFKLLDDHVPSQFLRGDGHKNGTRHLIFATDAQLEFLTNVKMWYVDATFKVIRQAFTQLFSIHAFVKKDGELMQTPLAFVVMSRRRRKDYKRVFRALIAALPCRPRVQAVVSDFEAAVWSAAREVLPGVLQRGCAFHFSQAKHPSSRSTVRVHVRRVRQPSVSSNDGIAIFTCRRHCRRVPDLAYCIRRPAGYTASAVHGAPVDQLHHLAAYYLVSLPSAGADQQRRRGLALSTERQGKSRPAQLIQVDSVAVRRSCIVQLNVHLLSEGHTMLLQRKSFAALHSRLSAYWDEYVTGTRSAHRLLRACSHLCKNM